jgi:pimeloyl-ACP methyl ester carboxylesterase
VLSSAAHMLHDRAPGRFVDVFGRRIHVREEGHGEPAVVLEAGSGGFSSHWCKVVAALAPHRRVVAYDRAGLGWSEPTRGPRHADALVDDLLEVVHTLVPREQRVVLVGHSYGGALMRLAAQRLGPRMGRVVFVDPWHESMATWQREHDDDPPRFLMWGYLLAARLGPLSALVRWTPTPAPPWPIDATSWKDILAISSTGRFALAAHREGQAHAQSDTQIATVTKLEAPIVVIVACRTLSPDDAPRGYPVEAHNAAWREAALRTARLSSRARVIELDDSDHAIPLRRPEVIVDAVLSDAPE